MLMCLHELCSFKEQLTYQHLFQLSDNVHGKQLDEHNRLGPEWTQSAYNEHRCDIADKLDTGARQR